MSGNNRVAFPVIMIDSLGFLDKEPVDTVMYLDRDKADQSNETLTITGTKHRSSKEQVGVIAQDVSGLTPKQAVVFFQTAPVEEDQAVVNRQSLLSMYFPKSKSTIQLTQEAAKRLTAARECAANGDFTGMMFNMSQYDTAMKSDIVGTVARQRPPADFYRRLVGE